MIKVFRRWIDRYFSDEEALLLLLLKHIFFLCKLISVPITYVLS